MIAKDYFKRQATTLLKMAKLEKDPVVAGGFVEKAADLQERSVTAPAALDAPLIPPDIQNKLG